ncbi:hypothetical protein EV426DRAFT_505634, partial [Tirmania nivea]
RALIILPTGGGKTLCFACPAIRDTHKITLVIVPYKALKLDLEERLWGWGIPCRQFDDGEARGIYVVVV